MKRNNLIVILALMMAALPIMAQQGDAPQVKIVPLRGQVHHVSGTVGGNIVAQIGPEGILLIDAGSVAAHQPLIRKALDSRSTKPVKYLINTHWHHDHTTGNVPWGEAGAKIIAHENVAKRLKVEQHITFLEQRVAPLPPAGIPVNPFKDVRTLQFNQEKIDIMHVAPGHTDGDAIVYFNEANVVHMGDLYFNGLYPYIGISSGGSIRGMIDVIGRLIGDMDDQTIVVPGHGPVSNKAELANYLTLLTEVRNAILPMVNAGKGLEEVIAAKPTAKFDANWGQLWLKGDDFARLVYLDLSR